MNNSRRSSSASSCGAALTPVPQKQKWPADRRPRRRMPPTRKGLLDVLDVLGLFAFLAVLSALLAVQPLGVGELGALGRPFRLGGGVGFVGGRRVEREGGARNEHAQGQRGDECR